MIPLGRLDTRRGRGPRQPRVRPEARLHTSGPQVHAEVPESRAAKEDESERARDALTGTERAERSDRNPHPEHTDDQRLKCSALKVKCSHRLTVAPALGVTNASGMKPEPQRQP